MLCVCVCMMRNVSIKVSFTLDEDSAGAFDFPAASPFTATISMAKLTWLPRHYRRTGWAFIRNACIYLKQDKKEKKNIPQLTIGENALTHNYTAFLASSAALSLLSSCKHLFRQQWLNERLIGQRLVAVRIAGIHSFCGTSFARSLWQRAGVRTR